MAVLLAALVVSAALSVGLRTTAGLLTRLSHPADRFCLAAVVGALLVTSALALSVEFGMLEAGLGLAVSLAPVGIFDIAKWWFKDGRSGGPWLVDRRASSVAMVLRWLGLGAMLLAGWWAIAIARVVWRGSQ